MWSVILPIVAFLIGGAVSYIFFKYGLKSRYDKVIKEAENEAEVIKKNKLLEVKEKFLNKKADLEKEVALRNQKIQQAENKLKQREMVLNQKNEELQRKRNENEAIKENLDAQLVIIDKKLMTIPSLMGQFQTSFSTNYNGMLSAIVIIMLPPIIVFCCFSKFFVKAMSGGAVKG